MINKYELYEILAEFGLLYNEIQYDIFKWDMERKETEESVECQMFSVEMKIFLFHFILTQRHKGAKKTGICIDSPLPEFGVGG